MNWDAQKMQDKRENNMRASEYSDKSFKSPTAHSGLLRGHEFLQGTFAGIMDAPVPCRVPSSGERIQTSLLDVAIYAEEVAELLASVTTRIVKNYPEACAEDPGAMKGDYIPDYFSDLRASTCRIRSALSKIQDITQRIDL